MSTILFDAIKTQSKMSDSVIVAFSGGKESVVVLDLCCRYFKKVQPFFMYIVPGLSFEERTLQWYEKRYQLDIIRVPQMVVSGYFRYGLFCNMDENVPIIGINDIYKYVRLQSDIWWIAAGERIADSVYRMARIRRSSSIDVKSGRFFPVAEWKKNDVLSYIKHHNLYLGQDSKLLGQSFRSLQGRELIEIKKHFPDDYAKIEAFYPLAGANVKREEIILQNGKE